MEAVFQRCSAGSAQVSSTEDRIVLDTGDGAAICFLGEPEVALLITVSMRRTFVDHAPQNGASPRIRLGINLE